MGPKAGGSAPDPSHGDDTDMEFVAPNLTAHATGITGELDEEAFLARFRGRAGSVRCRRRHAGDHLRDRPGYRSGDCRSVAATAS